MQKISVCLWFDSNAEEAVQFYTSLFKNSKVGGKTHYGEVSSAQAGQPKDSVLTVKFNLEGIDFLALNGGPMFNFTPAISYFVNCDTEAEVAELYKQLSDGGMVLMPLDKYPFSEKFAWVDDRFGVSWQINLGKHHQKIVPFLMFVEQQHGRAEEAANFYVSQFPNSKVISSTMVDPVSAVKRVVFTLNGTEFNTLDGGTAHHFDFSVATSLVANCDTQDEIDKLWTNLAEDGAIQQCGWLTDKYGVSWQVVPAALGDMLIEGGVEKSEKVMAEVFKMKKIDIATLTSAYRN